MHRSLLLLAPLCTLLPAALSAQYPQPTFDEGHGRIEAAPIMQVTDMQLRSNQVQTLNLWPRAHTMLQFPYVVARIDGGDDATVLATHAGNKVWLRPLDVPVSETTMTVTLATRDGLTIPFLVRSDTTQPHTYIIRYTDPVETQLDLARSQIASQMTAEEATRVQALAEEMVRSRFLWSSGPLVINKANSLRTNRGPITLHIHHAQQMPGPTGQQYVYIQYVVNNETPIHLQDVRLTVRKHHRERRFVFFRKTKSQLVPTVGEERSAPTIQPFNPTRGILVLENVRLSPGEWISIEMETPQSDQTIVIDRVLVGS